MYALTKIKGVGRRYSNLVCKKADVDLNKRFVPPPSPQTHQPRDPTLTVFSALAKSPPKNSSAS